MPKVSVLKEPGWSETSSLMQKQWQQQPMQQEPKKTQSIWMPQLITILHLTPQPQDQFMVPIFLAFNTSQETTLERTVPTTIAPTATG